MLTSSIGALQGAARAQASGGPTMAGNPAQHDLLDRFSSLARLETDVCRLSMAGSQIFAGSAGMIPFGPGEVS